MAETRAKVWFVNTKKNVVEITANDNGIIMDVYTNKKHLLKRYFAIIKHILFVKKPQINSKEELADAIHGFIDEYYDENEASTMKNQVLEDLELVDKNLRDTSYIG